jgi:hypothetical protein
LYLLLEHLTQAKKLECFKPLDIKNVTAGSNADIVAALQTLPGTNNVGEDGRYLFVVAKQRKRKHLLMESEYTTTAHKRKMYLLGGRFSPFYSAEYLSTGGYSAEYGEALSLFYY